MEITRQDLQDLKHDINDYTKERTDSIDSSIKDINATLVGHGRELSEHSVKIQNVEKQVQNRRQLILTDQPQSTTTSMTKGDVKLISAIIAGVGASIEVLHRVIAFFSDVIFASGGKHP